MTKLNEEKQKAIARALGSSRTFPVKKLNLGSPLSWLNLANEIKGRLISTGGRPSDPYWDTKRLVPFRKMVWNYLADEAKLMGTKGRKVGPAQLAAIIIENSLKQPVPDSSLFEIKIELDKLSERFLQKIETNAMSPCSFKHISISEVSFPNPIENPNQICSWNKTEDPGNLVTC